MASFARPALRMPLIPFGRISCQVTAISQRRGLASVADQHGPLKVNCWQDHMNPAKWKEEHFVLVSLSGWGLLCHGGYKFFTRGKAEKEEKPMEATQ